MITDSDELCRILDTRLGAFLGAPGRRDPTIEVRLAPPPGRMVVASRPLELDPSAAVEQAFGIIFRHLLDEVGEYLMLHGAALTAGDHALLVAGPSGSGKTTLALALMERGLRLLSDDMAPLCLADGLIHPFHKAPGIRPGAAATLAGAAPGTLDPRSLPADTLEDRPSPLGAVFFIGDPERSADPQAPYFFALTFSGPPAAEEVAAFDALPGVRLAARASWEIVLHIDPELFSTEAFEACLARHEGRLLEYGTIASIDHSRQGRPRARVVAPSRALLLLAREVQNRRRDGALERRAGNGQWLSGLAAALRGVPCWAVESGAPEQTAALVAGLFRAPQ